MSIKQRLRLSYLAMLIIPIVLTIIVSVIFGHYYFNDVEKYLNIKFSKGNVGREVTLKREPLFIEIKRLSIDNPDIFENIEKLKEMEPTLQKFSSGMVVRKNKTIIYRSSMLHTLQVDNILKPFGAFSEDIKVSYKNEKNALLMSQQDFYFSDRSQGSIFLVTNMLPAKQAFKKLQITVTVSIIFFLFMTNGLLTYFVFKSISKPLDKLKEAANQIKDGNLDFKVEVYTKDELGQLAQSFEEMRSRLKELNEIQVQYEENRKELLSNISHDLKTPITSIKGYILGIQEGIADTPEKMQRYVSTIYNKAKDLDQLIDELFLFSKLDLHKIPFHFQKINIYRYIEDFVEELELELENHKIAVEYTNLCTSQLEVHADPQQLKKVFINIVENAVKYMDKERRMIHITLKEISDEVEVQILDNGRGIPKETLPYIFDKFYRGDPSRNRQTGGSGLGLAIAKKMIEEHNGRMWAQSQLGEGTEIFFTLKKYEQGDTDEKSINC